MYFKTHSFTSNIVDDINISINSIVECEHFNIFPQMNFIKSKIVKLIYNPKISMLLLGITLIILYIKS